MPSKVHEVNGFVTVQQFADYHEISKQSVHRRCNRGTLKYYEVDGLRLIAESEMLNYNRIKIDGLVRLLRVK
jgi:hypothetical protein